MLQRAAVEPRTLAVLDKLMLFPELKDFVLVGGTALTLHLGHRISVDIDLFNRKKFDIEELLIFLDTLNRFKLRSRTGIGLHCEVDKVQTDLIYFPFRFIKPVIEENGTRIASVEDIAAMKVSAIYKRGSKKDFFDLYFLLKLFSLEQILDFFSEKFPDYDLFGLARSLTYFEDAEVEKNPIVLHENVTWKEVKSTIIEAVKPHV